jgi:cytochrome c-type biogenesis protein CcmH
MSISDFGFRISDLKTLVSRPVIPKNGVLRTTILWVSVWMGIFTMTGCDQHVQPLPEAGGPPVARPAETFTPVPASGSAGSISGTITITPALSARLTGSEMLFIMARQGGGPPLAVKRVSVLQFPMPYTLSQADQMVQGAPFAGEVSVIARIDRDGNAGPPQSGDMEGRAPTAMIGDAGVDIVIDKVY